ncbi:MAG: pilus assembly protein [Alphaproteobacteria bacterium]|nr:pilus assembly protein [Alphaproteobacteria bacterium]
MQNLMRWWRDPRGALVAEFAASLPMLLILVMSGFECARFVLLNQKLDRVTTTVADLVAQEETITVAEITALFDAITPIVTPFTFSPAGKMIVTSVVLAPDGVTMKVAWQESSGTFAAASKIGVANGTATLPAGMTIRTNETIIVGEVFYQFTPFFVSNWFSSTPLAQTLYHRAFYRPRFGALTTIS